MNKIYPLLYKMIECDLQNENTHSSYKNCK